MDCETSASPTKWDPSHTTSSPWRLARRTGTHGRGLFMRLKLHRRSVPKVIVEENAFCQLVTFICNICFSPKTILRRILVHWSCLVTRSYMTICILGHCQRFVTLPLCCEDLLMCWGFQRMCLSLSFASLSNKQRPASSPSSHVASTHKGLVQNKVFFF